ncbi:hypothetical protein CH363_16195 [Leptospira haakeii]|uniref:Uncharacterized protein n=2 Tax=Leptospira TaxID=171 RepID=A0A4R9G2R6_9LEPT|nr:hypothetical protein [Leptospira selangorensis]PKA14959.1 hypothetical protein CH363_16195 [Leptospira haakeii]PKA20769.1 hypothetical protein CH377_05705 [Leptospira haakeii]TGK05748.1 hypothetical protein EHO58_08230 [Leptospira selangorensis]TGM12452.1 hypothetical protein EHQ81_15435 [Leptospira selangorensis]TGM14503.1 hypothetical protein EHQ82_17170 [Leptospira selangorensis]
MLWLVLSFLYGVSIYSDVTNPWELPIDERILNRKDVSHIVLETRPGGFRVTLLINERFPYNYKSKSAAFYYSNIKDSKEGLELAEKLDRYLKSGFNMKIRFNGSEIYEFILDESIQ